MAASISRLNKLACRSTVMRYSLIETSVKLYLNKLKLKYGVFRNVKDFSSSADKSRASAKIVTKTSGTSKPSEYRLGT